MKQLFCMISFLPFLLTSFIGQQPQLKQTIFQELAFDHTQRSGKTIMVTSSADEGKGTLRQALEDAGAGDVITFDISIFPPTSPVAIKLLSGLPEISQTGVTLDASNAGVILDGTQAAGDWTAGLDVNGNSNTIMGFQISGFTGAGIMIEESASGNTIGGSRAIGTGPYGQGNLIRENSDGIGVNGSGNNVLGNLVGTDDKGLQKWGNNGPGIFLEGDANNNVIGPDNIVAYNGVQGVGGGIEVRSAKVEGNRFTQNELYDNSAAPIFFNYQAFEDPQRIQPPAILDFDLAKGTVNGVTCPQCVVELYINESDNKGVFTGQVVADAQGYFSYDQTKLFSGESLKATTYRQGYNTSEFSTNTSADSRSIQFQMNNTNSKQILSHFDFKDSSQNGIGAMHFLHCDEESGPGAAEDYILKAVEMGYKWTRLSVDWFDWAEVAEYGEYSNNQVTACEDKVIDLFNQNDIPILYTLVYWDPQIEMGPGYTRFKTDEEIEGYLEHVRFLVEHFKGKIKWYSILNEPNLPDNGQGSVKVEDYINLVHRVIPLIHEIDPEAKIVVGEVCPLNENGALDYLKTIINSDLMPLVDGIAWHNSSSLSPDYDANYYRNYPTWLNDMMTKAYNNGFKGQFFSTELQWRTKESAQPIGGNPWFYSNAVAAKYYARGIVFNRSQGFYITVGHENYESIPEVVQTISNLTGLMGGAKPEQIAITVSSKDVKTAAFSLPDGTRLVALWRDVKAVDNDPGKATTITLNKARVKQVTGIDPFYAFQQEIVGSEEAEGLVLKDVLVKDYPVFIRLESYETVN